MTNTPTEISVVICTYSEERWRDLIDAVDSVRQQTQPACEIVVVVDHNDDLLRRAHAHYRDVVVVASREPQGLSGARNTGIAASRGDVVAFLDDDATAAADWLAQLAVAYQDPRVLGVGGTVEPVWVAGRPSWFPDEFNWVVGCTYRGMSTKTASVRNLIGANMSFRHEVFQAVGGFRSGIGRVGAVPVGCEETELSIRASQRWPGKVILFEPRAKVYHRVPAGRANWDYFRARCYAEGLSKSKVSRLVGARDGLASERAYTLRTLPRGVARGISDALIRREGNGVAQAAAIVAGLGITGVGYAVGMLPSELRSTVLPATIRPTGQGRDV